MNKVIPGPGQESVWDYPRPPLLQPSKRRVRIEVDGEVIVDTTGAYRVLETSHPPVYYIPPGDIKAGVLEPSSRVTHCEYKGQASYYDIVLNGRRVQNAAWYYPNPVHAYREMRDYVAFYPDKVSACYLDDEEVKAQPGDFYGGWVSSDIVGPFKGGEGTWGW